MYSQELVTFINVAEQGSFLKTAQKMYLTPASIMNRMNKLEKDIGIKLIERTNHGTKLTKAGLSLYKDIKKIIREYEQAVGRARKIATTGQYTVRVGTSILRPCKILMDLWAKITDGDLQINIEIVPFEDNPESLEKMLQSLGGEIDCFVGSCNSSAWEKQYNIFFLKTGRCCIAVPRKHRLAKKKILCWHDLNGETMLLVKKGQSPVLDKLRYEIETQHPEIIIYSTEHFYDTSVFNQCEQKGYIMETLDIWQDVHPSIATLPMKWNYQMPYGIIYAKQPSKAMQKFIDIIRKNISKEEK